MVTDTQSREQLLAEIENLRVRLDDAEQTLRAIQDNEVDAFVVATPQGDRIFTLQGAEHPYRLLVESMNEGAATLAPDGSVMYSNHRLAELLQIPLKKLIGSTLRSYVTPADALIFAALLEKCAQERCKGEIELITGAGDTLPVLLSCGQIDPGESPGWLSVVVTDLSEQKRSERIMAAEKLARSIIEQAGEIIVVCDKAGEITRTSQQANLLCGTYPLLRLFDTVLPLRMADSDSLFSIAAPLQGAVFRNVEVVFKAPHDDRTFSLLLNAIPLKNDQDEIFGCVVTLTDITAHKRIEEALSESEERLRLFIQYAPAGLAMFDRGMHYLYASYRWLIDYGLSDRDLYGLSHYDVFPEISAEWKEAHRRGLAGEVVRSEGDRFERADGSVQWVRWELRPWYTTQRAIGGIVIFTEEITAAKEAEAALRQSEALYRAIGESIDYGIWVCAPDGRNTYASDSFLKLVGLTQEQCSNFGWGDVLHPDDAEHTLTAWKECVRTGSIWDIEHRYRGVDGHYHAVLARGVPVKNERGEVVCWAGINLDIQHLKQAEEALRESEQQFRHLADAMPQIVWITDPQGRILFTNQRWCEFTGLNHEQSALNTARQSVIHPDDFPGTLQKWESSLATGFDYDHQLRFRQAADGVYHWFLSRGVAVKDSHGHIVRWFGTSTDIEDQKRMEESLCDALIEAQRHDAQMIILNRMNDLLLSCETPEEAYENILHSAGTLFNGYAGGLAIREESTLDLRVAACWGEVNNLSLRFALRDCWGLRRGAVHEVLDPAHSVHCRHFAHRPEGAYLCVPLTVQGKTLGLLHVSADCALSEKQFQELRNLTLMVSESIKLALSNLQLRQALREQATHDALTGLFNRRYLDETLPRELHRHQRSGEPMAVAMLDLDHFKRFNDSYGHEAGDIALQMIGDLLRRSLRAGDLACRYGGEELTVIMPGSSLEDAQTRLDELRRAIMYLHLSYRDGELPAMTVSIGVAAAGAEETDATVLLGRADAALYQAKEQGRNRVVVATTG